MFFIMNNINNLTILLNLDNIKLQKYNLKKFKTIRENFTTENFYTSMKKIFNKTHITMEDLEKIEKSVNDEAIDKTNQICGELQSLSKNLKIFMKNNYEEFIENLNLYHDLLSKYDESHDKKMTKDFVKLKDINRIIFDIHSVLKDFKKLDLKTLFEKISNKEEFNNLPLKKIFDKESIEKLEKIGIQINDDDNVETITLLKENIKDATLKELDYTPENFIKIFKNIKEINVELLYLDKVINQINFIREQIRDDKQKNEIELIYFINKFLIIYQTVITNIIYHEKTFFELLKEVNIYIQEGVH